MQEFHSPIYRKEEYEMLMYGNMQDMKIALTDKCKVINFSSMNEQMAPYRLHLIPDNIKNIVFNDEPYWDWILGDDDRFLEFISIVHPIYMGSDVYVLISDFMEEVNESLMKLIQLRYGIIPNRIRTMDDLVYSSDITFSREGMIRMDQDIERLSFLIMKRDLDSNPEKRNAYEQNYNQFIQQFMGKH